MLLDASGARLCLVVRNPPELPGKENVPEHDGEQEWFDEPLKM